MAAQKNIMPTALADIAQPLPHNLEAERSILGAVLLNNQALITAIEKEKIRSEDFFLSQHRQIFERMIQLAAKQQPIDVVTLMDDLARRGELESAGGIAYLSQLTDGLPKVTNVEHYARIVKEKAVLRSLIFAAASIQDRAFAAADDVDVILASAQEQIAALKVPAGDDWQKYFHLQSELSKEPSVPLIDGILPETGITAIGSLSGRGKTYVGLSIVKALTTGEPLFGVFPVNGIHNCLYLVPEMGEKAFRARLEKFKIPDDRLRVQTMRDPVCSLTDPNLLRALEAMNPVLQLDTLIRFSTAKSEDDATETGQLASQLFSLLRAGAKQIIAQHHAPKSADSAEVMTKENMLRGSGDFGGLAECVWGMRYARRPDQKKRDTEYEAESDRLTRLDVQNLKPRDLDPVANPFVIQGRPHIDQHGDFVVLTDDLEGGANEATRVDQAITADPSVSKRALEVKTRVGRNRIEAVADVAGWRYDESSAGKRGIWVKK